MPPQPVSEGADAWYGKGPGFCTALDEMDETFVVDVHSDFHAYLQDPQPYLQEKKQSWTTNHKVSDGS